MSKRLVSGVFCGLLSMAIGCGEKKPPPLKSCSPVSHKVLVKDGVRFLHVTLPDTNVVIINLDTLPAAPKPRAAPSDGAGGSAGAPPPAAGSGSDSVFLHHVCPCEEDPCRPLCHQLRQLAGPGASICPAPAEAAPH
jgi:hypothetical protein